MLVRMRAGSTQCYVARAHTSTPQIVTLGLDAFVCVLAMTKSGSLYAGVLDHLRKQLREPRFQVAWRILGPAVVHSRKLVADLRF